MAKQSDAELERLTEEAMGDNEWSVDPPCPPTVLPVKRNTGRAPYVYKKPVQPLISAFPPAPQHKPIIVDDEIAGEVLADDYKSALRDIVNTDIERDLSKQNPLWYREEAEALQSAIELSLESSHLVTIDHDDEALTAEEREQLRTAMEESTTTSCSTGGGHELELEKFRNDWRAEIARKSTSSFL